MGIIFYPVAKGQKIGHEIRIPYEPISIMDCQRFEREWHEFFSQWKSQSWTVTSRGWNRKSPFRRLEFLVRAALQGKRERQEFKIPGAWLWLELKRAWMVVINSKKIKVENVGWKIGLLLKWSLCRWHDMLIFGVAISVNRRWSFVLVGNWHWQCQQFWGWWWLAQDAFIEMFQTSACTRIFQRNLLSCLFARHTIWGFEKESINPPQTNQQQQQSQK